MQFPIQTSSHHTKSSRHHKKVRNSLAGPGFVYDVGVAWDLFTKITVQYFFKVVWDLFYGLFLKGWPEI
jgi:hypothetical protein